MSEYDLNKLRKDLQRKQDQLKEEKEDHRHTQDELVRLQAVPFPPSRKGTATTPSWLSIARQSRRWRP